MARNLIRVNLELDRIKCFDEGDGWGDAEPYLWTVFFKIDGATVHVTDAFKLSGHPTTQNTPGSHGNLGTKDVDEGDIVTIPAAIGEWETILTPIPGPPSFSDIFEDLGGTVGVVAVLMEEDNVTDDGAEAGHQALNAAVREVLQEIIDTRSITNQDVSEEEIQGFVGEIQEKVKDAITSQQNFFEDFWSWLNADDTIGVSVITFKHDELDPAVNKNFTRRYLNHGDWQLQGHITSTPICPADALKDFLERLSAQTAGSLEPAPGGGGSGGEEKGMGASIDIEPLRKFRDGPFREMPGLGRWFALVERHIGRVVHLALEDPALIDSIRKTMEWGNLIARQPDAQMPRESVEHAERLLKALAGHRNRRARMDAKRALSALEEVKGKTHREALRFLADVGPARYPSEPGKPRKRAVSREVDPEEASQAEG